jgi:hypothetical protein
MLGRKHRLCILTLVPTSLSLWLVGQCVVSAQDAAGLTEAEFRKLHKQLQPARDELWRTIPWQMSILDACEQAAREKKPLVMRVRSGHPLGCV